MKERIRYEKGPTEAFTTYPRSWCALLFEVIWRSVEWTQNVYIFRRGLYSEGVIFRKGVAYCESNLQNFVSDLLSSIRNACQKSRHLYEPPTHNNTKRNQVMFEPNNECSDCVLLSISVHNLHHPKVSERPWKPSKKPSFVEKLANLAVLADGPCIHKNKRKLGEGY